MGMRCAVVAISQRGRLHEPTMPEFPWHMRISPGMCSRLIAMPNVKPTRSPCRLPHQSSD